MTLYVVTQPDPPAGTDFALVVPGRYLYDVTGITATLTTGGGVGAMADSSGNGRDGVYQNGLIASFVPGLVAGDDAFQCTVGGQACGTYPGQLIDPFANCTVECVVQPTSVNTCEVWGMQSDDGNTQLRLTINADGSIGLTLAGTNGTVVWAAVVGTFPFDNAPHHLAATYTAATHAGHLYLDGVSISTSPPQDPGVATAPIYLCCVGAEVQNFIGTGAACDMIIDEPACYQSVLSAATVAAHNAARAGGFVAYSAAVLGSAPFAYYHVDNVTGSTGRQPSLIVTDGTTELEAIPTGFPAVATPGPYEYSWQPGLRADTQSSDGTLTTVAIPELLLPAGYAVGVRTLDLQPGDQWSAVTLWWDDAVQRRTIGLDPYAFPPGAFFVYQQIGT